MKILREAVVTSRFVYISPSRPVTILLNDYPFYKGLKARAYVNDLRDEFVFRSDIPEEHGTSSIKEVSSLQKCIL